VPCLKSEECGPSRASSQSTTHGSRGWLATPFRPPAKSVLCYVERGNESWAAGACPRRRTALRLALRRAAKAARYHAMREGGSAREIAGAIGRRLNLPRLHLAGTGPGNLGQLALLPSLRSDRLQRKNPQRIGWDRPDRLIGDLENLQLRSTEHRQKQHACRCFMW